MQPGKEPLDLPAATTPPQWLAILPPDAIAAIGCNHFDTVAVISVASRGSLSYPPSPINRQGSSGRNRASMVAGTRCGSYGEALAM